MDFFEQVGEKITETSKKVSKSAKNLADTAKLNTGIIKKKSELNDLFNALGKLYYNNNKDDNSDQYGLIIKNINTTFNSIDAMYQDIDNIRNSHKNCDCDTCSDANDFNGNYENESDNDKYCENRRCPNCGASANEENIYCTKCGTKL